jgi:hypothetical protein
MGIQLPHLLAKGHSEMNTDEITLTRIANLIRKLEDEHPETHNLLRIAIYDDFSGHFEYDVLPEFGGWYVETLVSFYGEGEGTLESLMKKYGV